jgi:hypothetical protein
MNFLSLFKISFAFFAKLIFEMSPERAKSLMRRHKTEMSRLKKRNAELYGAIQNILENKTAGFIYFDLPKNANP